MRLATILRVLAVLELAVILIAIILDPSTLIQGKLNTVVIFMTILFIFAEVLDIKDILVQKLAEWKS